MISLDDTCWRGSTKLGWCHWHIDINVWLDDIMPVYFGTVNPLGYWLRIPFGTRFHIPLRGLSGFRVIGFRIPWRGLSGFWVPPGFVVTARPLPVPVCRSFGFSMFFLLNILVSLFYGAKFGGVKWHNLLDFSFPIPRICGNDFVVFCLWPNKILCLLLWIFFLSFY